MREAEAAVRTDGGLPARSVTSRSRPGSTPTLYDVAMDTLPHEHDMYEIRWHGRGGQGAVPSAKVLADAAFRSGFEGVTSQPSFGAERRGAPITASSRLAHEQIRVLSQVTTPDIVVVLDDSLLGVANATAGMKPGGTIIVNTTKAPSELGIAEGVRVVTSDVTGAAQAVGLI